MSKYIKKPIPVEATQWFKDGDHEVVKVFKESFRHCTICNKPVVKHGWIETLEGGHIVCPSDWIIKGVRGEFYAIKNNIFLETYEKVV